MLGHGLELQRQRKRKGSIITNGLVLWLDGKDFKNSPPTNPWLDKSGNGNNAIPSNFGYVSGSGSDGTGGVVGDGVDDYLQVPNPISGASIFTLTINFKHVSPVAYTDLFTFGSEDVARMSRVEYTGSNKYAWYESGIFTSGRQLFTHDGTQIDNITLCCDGTNAYCYRNGTLSYSQPKDILNLPIASYINIFTKTPIHWGYFKGLLRHLIIYNRCLTPTEIMNNYNTLR